MKLLRFKNDLFIYFLNRNYCLTDKARETRDKGAYILALNGAILYRRTLQIRPKVIILPRALNNLPHASLFLSDNEWSIFRSCCSQGSKITEPL